MRPKVNLCVAKQFDVLCQLLISVPVKTASYTLDWWHCDTCGSAGSFAQLDMHSLMKWQITRVIVNYLIGYHGTNSVLIIRTMILHGAKFCWVKFWLALYTNSCWKKFLDGKTDKLLKRNSSNLSILFPIKILRCMVLKQLARKTMIL